MNGGGRRRRRQRLTSTSRCTNGGVHLQAKGEKPLTNLQWRQVVEKKACRGRMWKMMGERTIFARDVGTLSPKKEAEQRGFENWLGENSMRTGMPSAKRCTKALKEKTGKKYMSLTKKSVGL